MKGYADFFTDIERLLPGRLNKVKQEEAKGDKRYKSYTEALASECGNWFIVDECLPEMAEWRSSKYNYHVDDNRRSRIQTLVKEVFQGLKDIAPGSIGDYGGLERDTLLCTQVNHSPGQAPYNVHSKRRLATKPGHIQILKFRTVRFQPMHNAILRFCIHNGTFLVGTFEAVIAIKVARKSRENRHCQ